MPGMIDAALDSQQAVQVNPVGISSSVLSSYAVFPGNSESGPFYIAEKVFFD
jgi:hypothetical protein